MDGYHYSRKELKEISEMDGSPYTYNGIVTYNIEFQIYFLWYKYHIKYKYVNI